MPIQSQGIITRHNVSVDVSAVAYFKIAQTNEDVLIARGCDDLCTLSHRPCPHSVTLDSYPHGHAERRTRPTAILPA